MRKRFFFLGLAFVVLIAQAFAAVPTVDFNWTPTTPKYNETITFDPTITTDSNISLLNWQFNSDGNQNFISIASVFQDDFSDGDYNVNPVWTVNAGTWTAASNYLSTSSLDGNISTAIDLNVSAADYNIHAKVYSATGAHDIYYYFAAQSTGNIPGYRLLFNDVGPIEFQRVDANGAATTLITGPAFPRDEFIDVNITERQDGNWSLDVNGVNYGSVLDSTFADFNTILLRNGGGAVESRFDDFNILQDANILNYDDNVTHAFSTSGSKEVCLTAQNTTGNSTTCHALNVYGSIRLTFFDENTDSQFAPSSVTVNGTLQSLDGNTLDYSLLGVTALTDFTVLASDANKTQRQWFINDRNQDDVVDLNVLMLDANLGSSIQFRFFEPDQTTVLDNAVIWVVRDDANQPVAEIRQADSVGRVTFFLERNATKYVFRIDANQQNVFDFNYSPVLVTVKIPKDEDLLINITPFRVQVTGLTSLDFNGISAGQDFNVFANTEEYYKIAVDDVGERNHFGRDYILKFLGNPLTFELQPYLVSDAELSSTINVVDTPNGNPLENIVIKAFTDVEGDQTLVESKQTDSAGNGLFSFVVGRDYSLEFDLNDSAETTVFTSVINATATTYFVVLFLGDLNLAIPEGFYLDANYLQRQVVYNSITQTFDLNGTVWTNQDVLTSITWNVYNDGNLLFTENRTTNLGLYNDFNQTIVLLDQNASVLIRSEFVVDFSIDGVGFRKTLDPVFNFSNVDITDFQTAASNLKDDLGAIVVAIVAIVIALGAHGFAANNFATNDYRGLVLLFAGVLWGFVMLGWIDLTAMALASAIGAATWMRERGG